MEIGIFENCCSTWTVNSYIYIHLRKTQWKRQSRVKLSRSKNAQARCLRTPSEHSMTPTFSLKCSQHSVSETDTCKPAILDEEASLLKKKAEEITSDLRGTCLFFVGMAGSVKTTVGRTLSEVLGYYFFDSEELLEQASGGRSAAHKFRQEDEEGFRDSESEVLHQLSSMGRLVVSTGDSALVRADNLGYMRHGITIWLDVPLEALAKHIVEEEAETQAHLGQTAAESYSQVLERLTKSFEERRKGYATADIKVSLQKITDERGYDEDVFTVTPKVIAIEVLKAIGKLLRYKKLQEAAAAPEIQRKVR